MRQMASIREASKMICMLEWGRLRTAMEKRPMESARALKGTTHPGCTGTSIVWACSTTTIARVRFSDGSVYKGQMIDGKISGEGSFNNPHTGELREGVFKDGVLHGRGKFVTCKREVYEGEFFEGELHGMGRFKDKNGDIYEGEFRHGHKSGRGKMVYANGDVYEGYFHDDLRHGHGCMTYGNVRHTYDPKTAKTYLVYDHRYEGDWQVGKIRARGSHSTIVHSDTHETEPTNYYTTNNRSRGYPHLFSIYEKEARRERRKRRMYRRLRIEALEKKKRR